MRRDLAFPATLWLVFLALAAGPSARGEERSLCTVDDSREAACYAASEPEAYLRSRAVARLLVGGTLYCTGWLVGNQGHLLTAAHCIEDAEDAEDVRVELGAEGASCATACQTPGACAGTVVATSVTLIHANEDLDYSLVQLPINPTPTFGYLQLRASGAVVGERVYVPQQPQGWGRRIALASTYPADLDGFPHAVSRSEAPCHAEAAVPFVGYYADTQPGASGSPVIAYADHRVIALNLCHGSTFCVVGGEPDTPNRGLPVEAIIADLGPLLPPSAVGQELFADGFETGNTSAWTIVVSGPAPLRAERRP